MRRLIEAVTLGLESILFCYFFISWVVCLANRGISIATFTNLGAAIASLIALVGLRERMCARQRLSDDFNRRYAYALSLGLCFTPEDFQRILNGEIMPEEVLHNNYLQNCDRGSLAIVHNQIVNPTCRFYANSEYLKCAVAPNNSCKDCQFYEPISTVKR
jgi:hypothetical protein